MAEPLYLVRGIIDPRALVSAAVLQGHGSRVLEDPTYLAHVAVRGMFGAELRPYDIAERGRTLSVLGYSSKPGEALIDEAMRFADDPAVVDAWRVDQVRSRPMPEHWPEGTIVGFDLRACPVVRPREDERSTERDAFLIAVARTPGIDRASAYRSWLEDQIVRRGGAALETCQMFAFQLRDMVRRTQREEGEGRRARRLVRPDVVLSGTLRITDGPAFTELLRVGVGRHRGFGFGMLKLRRP
jgi:CRISPR system Cascade subunit CasE